MTLYIGNKAACSMHDQGREVTKANINSDCGGDMPIGDDPMCGFAYDIYIRQYPQGWRYYAGDTCPHGMYVGGCGADVMCGPCEGGD